MRDLRKILRLHALDATFACTRGDPTNSRAPYSKDQRARTLDARFGVFREASALAVAVPRQRWRGAAERGRKTPLRGTRP
jgi:hypothetical protein